MTYDTRKPGRIGALGYALMFAVAVVLAALVLHQFAALLDRPEVRVSYTTGKCVEVVDYKALADFFNTSVDYLMGRTLDPWPTDNPQPEGATA